MSPQFEELWLDHAVAAFGKQLYLAEFLGEHDWQWEAEIGQLFLRRHDSPGEVLAYATQALGSESQMSETWQWIWANELAELPAEVMRAAAKLREIGNARAIPEFQRGEWALSEADGHVLSLVASGLLRSGAYYRGPYLGGAGFVLIDDARFPTSPLPDAPYVIRVFSQAVSSLAIADHRRAFRAYLRFCDWQIEEQGDTILGQGNRSKVKARFDDLQRLIELNSVVTRDSLQN